MKALGVEIAGGILPHPHPYPCLLLALSLIKFGSCPRLQDVVSGGQEPPAGLFLQDVPDSPWGLFEHYLLLGS